MPVYAEIGTNCVVGDGMDVSSRENTREGVDLEEVEIMNERRSCKCNLVPFALQCPNRGQRLCIASHLSWPAL